MYQKAVFAAIDWMRDKRSQLGAEEVEELEIYLARDLWAEIWKSPVSNHTLQKQLLMDVFGKQPDEFEADVSSCFVELSEKISGAPVAEFNPIINCFFAFVVVELHMREMLETSEAAAFDERTIDYLDQLVEKGQLHQKFFPSRTIEFGRAIFPRLNSVVDPLGHLLRLLETKTVDHLQCNKELKALSNARGWIRYQEEPEPKEETNEPNADLDKSSVDEKELAARREIFSQVL
ncbi:unnamed protein product [Trichogramma brassicae]|uniref:Uncharacterized protein n=1 Tax=Trichogramma brassicae TaxID=86971 RepID=A0A6H5IM24_9HYME|nr:unnamed protein product [Trichogramma brassicae]